MAERSGQLPRPREGKVRVNFECDPDTWEKFKAVAAKDGRTRSGQLRWLMAVEVDRLGKNA